MRKEEALNLFGNVTQLANAVGVSLQAISSWPEVLTDRIADRVIAAGVRTGKDQRKLRILAQRSGPKSRVA